MMPISRAAPGGGRFRLGRGGFEGFGRFLEEAALAVLKIFLICLQEAEDGPMDQPAVQT